MEKLRIGLSKLRCFIGTVLFLMLLLVIVQSYLFYSYDGNLVISIVNDSNIDSIPVEVLIDGELAIDKVYTNEIFHNYDFNNFDCGFGDKVLTLRSKENNMCVSTLINTTSFTSVTIGFHSSLDDSSELSVNIIDRKLPMRIE